VGRKELGRRLVTGFLGSIEDLALKNNDFREVLFTGRYCQLVVMCLQPGEEIGTEVHGTLDQFFRIEQGEAKYVLNDTEEHLAQGTDGVVIPAGTRHNVINTSQTQSLKLYTVYSPPNHPVGTVHKTQADAEAAEAKAHH
jgi:mannose-6-phosphate isomerase-like protein (cupin superfamily)